MAENLAQYFENGARWDISHANINGKTYIHVCKISYELYITILRLIGGNR
jgi:hypothetical protein